MKKHPLPQFLALSLGLGALSAIPAAQASQLSYESFDVSAGAYTAGTLAGQNPTVTGYSGAWTGTDFGTQRPAAGTGSLDYTGAGYPTETGGKASVASNTGGDAPAGSSGRVYRQLDSSLTVTNSTAGELYMSFLFQRGTGTGSNLYQTLALGDTATFDSSRRFDIGINASTSYNFGVNNVAGTGQDYSSTGVTADTGVHLFVVKFTLSATNLSDSVTVWMDPTISGSDPAGGTTVTGRNLTWDKLALSDYDDNSAAWDEIRWGTTIADVVPEPGTYATLLGSLGVLTFLRRRKA